jgi:hypothetical protein
MPELDFLRAVASTLWSRLRLLNRAQAGYSTEAVVVTALLVALAIVAVGIITAKVISKANSIQTGG